MREKSEMNLREAAQQALDALELGCTDHDGNPVDLVGPAINALRDALAEEQNYVNRWISVEENLPKEGQLVLGLYYKSNITIVYRKAREIIDDRWVIEDEWVEPSSGHYFIPPTHWMPLPEYEHVHKMESNPTINEMETVAPVAWRFHDGKIWCYVTHISDLSASNKFEPLYTAPPKREPLTEQKIIAIDWKSGETLHDFARAIERAHGIGGEE